MIKKILICILLLTSILITGCGGATSFSSSHQAECQKVCIDEGLQLRLVQHAGNNNVICNCEKIIVHELG